MNWFRTRGRGTAVAAVAVGLMVCAAAGCGGKAAGTGDKVSTSVPAKPTTARIMVYDGAYTSMPVFIAQDLGFYKKYHLVPKLVKVSSGPAGVAAAIGGSIDFVEPPTDQIILNQAKNVDLKVVVGNETRHFYSLVVRKDLPLPHASEGYKGVMKDLKGKRIGVNALGATTQLMTSVMLKDAGMSDDDVHYVAIGSANTALAAWNAHRVDAVMGFTPFREIVEANGSGRTALDMSKGDGPELFTKMGGAFEGFSAKADYIDTHPDAVHAFIKAQQDAIAWMKDGKNAAALTKEVEKRVNLTAIPEQQRAKTVALMTKHYNGYLGATVDRNAVSAWNTYLKDNELSTKAIPAAQVVYVGAPRP